ncbi:hypothetical protein GCM10027447_21420 [Glycomyces halotolerans]
MEGTTADSLRRMLLDDYRDTYKKREPASLPNSVIRSFSEDTAELLAHHVLDGTGEFADIVDVAEAGKFLRNDIKWSQIHPSRLAMAARVLALRAESASEFARAQRFYDLLVRTHGAERMPDFHQGVHIQLAFRNRDIRRTRTLLADYPRSPAPVRSTMELNLANPLIDPSSHWDAWFSKLQNLMPSARFSMSQDDPEQSPLDRLRADPLSSVRDAATVTVVVTCFEPDEQLLTAVRSISRQSWENLDILVIDDASSHDCRPVLKSCEAIDERVRVVRLEENRGTYHARNLGLDLAHGEFVTFQDSDDWSHPQRIEGLMRLLLADDAAKAVVADGIKIGSDLTVDRVGRPLIDVSMPTTMFRLSEVRDRIGYFHDIRRSADGEYLDRIRAAFGENSVIRERSTAYKLIRQTADSLSRGDFGAGGWMHPAREAYMSAIRLWHGQIREGRSEPYMPREGNRRRLPVHRHLSGEAVERPMKYDFVFATDWRPYGAPAKAIIEEIRALKAAGRTLGVLQLETLRYMAAYTRPLCAPIQALINEGVVDRLLPVDEVEVGALIIRYPPVLQFKPGTEFKLKADRVVILANQAPSEGDGSDRRYVAADCSANARSMFGVEPEWLPEGRQTRAALESEGTLPASAILDTEFPCVVDPAEWAMPRRRFRSDLPVIGRHSRDHYTKWPATKEQLLEVYPDDRGIDVRIMGGTTAAANLLETGLPPNWTSFEYDAMNVKAFLYQLDFWIYFHHPVLIESFGLAVLEAMATGCVVVLPERFEPTFGPGAVYCRENQVQDVIREFYGDFARFKAQSDKGLETVRRRFSHGSMLERLERLSLLVS